MPVLTIAWRNGIETVHGTHGVYLYDGDYELMQYTGLKDKNGKEIYEGDILLDNAHNGYQKRYKVIYRDNNSEEFNGPIAEYGFDLINPLGGGGFCMTVEKCFIESDELIITGNIYQNPELL